MRLPFDVNTNNIEENARVKFIYKSSELNQNIEISLNGDEATVENLLDAFTRFLGALGLALPDNVELGFIEFKDGEEENENEDDEEKFE